jgi:hypothetical protein
MRKFLSTTISFTILMSFAALSVNAHQHEERAENMAEALDDAPACGVPASPIIPDGNVASEDELVAASKGIKAYQTSLVDYRLCLDKKQEALDPEAESTIEETQVIKAAYDTSIDAETAVAEEFNGAVRAFKERQPAN